MRQTRQRMVPLVIALVTACALGACAKSQAPQRQLTERERDSTLGKSAIPGGAAVTRALEVSDSSAARAQRMNGVASGQ